MPRTPREKSPTGIYHVIMRGVNRQKIFGDNYDRRKILDILSKFRKVSEYRIFAYCLMDNHIHILIQEKAEPLSKAMKRISSSYVLYFNQKYERVGHLFQERFRSEVVDNDQYFLTALRYIHQNPLKAQIVKEISSYPWSSYNEYFSDGYLVDKDYVLDMFGATCIKALVKFTEFHKELNNDNCLEIEEPKINDEQLKDIIKSQLGIEVANIKSQFKNQQDNVLRKIKAIDGVNARQISRITGLSYSRVWRA